MNTTKHGILIVLLVALVSLVGCDFGKKKVDDAPEQTPVASGPSAAELQLTQLHAQYAAGRAITLGEVAFTAQQGKYDEDGDLVFEGVMFRLPDDEFATVSELRFKAMGDDGLAASVAFPNNSRLDQNSAVMSMLEPEVDALDTIPAK